MALARPASAQVPAAQVPAAEVRANELRAQSRAALAEGQIESAYRLARAAAELSTGADAWLDVAEIAERLRLDALAIRAYQAYLGRSPRGAEGRVEIEARVRVLEHHLRGGGFALSADERTVETLVDRDGGAARAPGQGNVLVDWHGRPQVRQRPRSQLALAAWDDATVPEHQSLIPSSRILGSRAQQGLGRALATP